MPAELFAWLWLFHDCARRGYLLQDLANRLFDIHEIPEAIETEVKKVERAKR